MAITSSSFLPLPTISSKHVYSSFSSESLTGDPKVVMDFFLGGEVTGSGLNMSLGVNNYVCIFNQWD
jgi:hypothetical protein